MPRFLYDYSARARPFSVLLAQAGGVRAAFTAGATISVLAIVASFFVTKPANDDAPASDEVSTTERAADAI